MPGKIKVSLVTPRGIVLDREVDEVIAPGVMGEFGVLIGHTPMLTFIKPGLMSYLENDRFTKFAVGTGFCEVLKDHVTLLVDEAYAVEELDPAEAADEVHRLEQELLAVDSAANPEEHQIILNKLKVARAKEALISGS